MKNFSDVLNRISVIFVALFLFYSLTPDVKNITYTQPNLPKDIKVIESAAGGANIEKALNTYTKIGYVIKSSSYSSNGYCFIILEKY